jgi:HlyD family secretion protein
MIHTTGRARLVWLRCEHEKKGNEVFTMNKQAIPLIGFIAAAMTLSACAMPGSGAAQASSASGEHVTVTKGAIQNTVIATGKVTARSTTTIAFSRSGAVESLLIKEGDQVKKGQPLASLDTRELQNTAEQQHANYLSALASYSQTIKGPTDAELASAQAAIASAQSAYSDLFVSPSDNTLANLHATLLNAEATLKQKQAAYDMAYKRDPAGIGGSSAGLDLEKATNDYNAAKANYDKEFEKPKNSSVASAAASVASAKANLAALTPVTETIAQSKAKLDQAYAAWQQAEDNVNDATIVAPYDGLVTSVYFEVGDWQNTGSAAVDIVDFTEPIFEVNVDETDLGNVKVGKDARILLQTYPDTPITATVQSIAKAGTTSGSIVTYKVKLVMNTAGQSQAEVLLGMSGTSEIVTQNIQDALLVPNRALIADSTTKGYSVQRLKADNTIETVAVKLGALSADNAQVLEGVKEGDTLVVPTSSAVQQFGPQSGAGAAAVTR